MIEQVQVYFVLTACFLLTFFVIAWLVERFQKKERVRFILKNIPWDIFWEIFVVWTLILFLRKQHYYTPIYGIIQTKDSILWVDLNFWFFVFSFLGMVLTALAIVIRSKIKAYLQKKGLRNLLSYLEAVIIFGFVVLAYMTYVLPMEIVGAFIFKFLLPLKMICSGKYLGLLTGILMAYYIVDGYKRLNKKTITIRKRKLPPNIFVGIGFFLIYIILIPIRFSGGWDKKFTAELHNAQIEKSVRKFEDLLDAAPFTLDEECLKDIAVAVSKIENWQWGVDIAKTIIDSWTKFEALEQIFVITSKSENREEPEAVFQAIMDHVKPMYDLAKFRALKEMRRLTFKTRNANWVVKVIQEEALETVRIESPKARIRTLTEVAADIVAKGYKNRVKEIFQPAIEQVKVIMYKRDQYLILGEIAVTVAKIGDIQWAESLVKGIPFEDIKTSALEEIRRKKEEK